MAKTLLLYLVLALTASKCNLEQEEANTYLIVSDDTELVHGPTTLKIRVNQYDLSKLAGTLAEGLLAKESVESVAKDYDLNKSFSYAATLPNGKIERGGILNFELPKALFQFQHQNQHYQVTATQIEDGALGDASVTFEILPTKAISALNPPISAISAQNSHHYNDDISNRETFSDASIDVTFFMQTHDLDTQTVTGDLSLPNADRVENITLKAMQLIDFDYQGVKYQFGVRKIENYECEFFVREKSLN